MAAGGVDVGKIAQARAFKTVCVCVRACACERERVRDPFPDWNISLNPVPVFEFGDIDKGIGFFLLVGK
jgi:hypothetical protein